MIVEINRFNFSYLMGLQAVKLNLPSLVEDEFQGYHVGSHVFSMGRSILAVLDRMINKVTGNVDTSLVNPCVYLHSLDLIQEYSVTALMSFQKLEMTNKSAIDPSLTALADYLGSLPLVIDTSMEHQYQKTTVDIGFDIKGDVSIVFKDLHRISVSISLTSVPELIKLNVFKILEDKAESFKKDWTVTSVADLASLELAISSFVAELQDTAIDTIEPLVESAWSKIQKKFDMDSDVLKYIAKHA